MSELANIEREIEQGLARMRSEIGIPQPSKMPRAAFILFLLSFALVGAVVFGVR